jgi:hypothetical protein
MSSNSFLVDCWVNTGNLIGLLLILSFACVVPKWTRTRNLKLRILLPIPVKPGLVNQSAYGK